MSCARLTKGRKSLFGLLGPAFAQKCLLNPLLKLHIFRMYSDPIVRCGLSSMALRNTQMETINKFQRKILRAFLSLSDKSPIPGIHFIFGEISLEAKIHRDVFSVFFSVLKNPKAKFTKSSSTCLKKPQKTAEPGLSTSETCVNYTSYHSHLI